MASRQHEIEDIRKAEEEIMKILSEHSTPNWDKLGELMRKAKW